MKNKKGYTIIELVIVIAIIIIIAGIFSINIIFTQKKQKTDEGKVVTSEILSAANTYVSVNPEKVEALYNGSGYVDIYIGDLREAGLLDEKLTDAETNEIIPDDEKIRIKLETGDNISIKYPVEGTLDTWELVLEDLYVDYDENSHNWCEINRENILSSNVFTGLVTDLSNYTSIKSKMYLMNTQNKALIFDGNYFDENGFNLRVDTCDVNQAKTGTYSISYKYMDTELNAEKTGKRTVYVASFSDDVISTSAVINEGTAIIRGTNPNIIPITIKETRRNDDNIIKTTIGKLSDFNYTLDNFSTENVTSNAKALLTRTKKNSDGSLPKQEQLPYTVIPDVYTMTYDVNNGYALSKDNKKVKYNVQYGKYDTPIITPTRRGYTFNYWHVVPKKCIRANNTLTFTTDIPSDQINNDTNMINLCDHTIKAHWTPNKYTVYFNANTGSVDQTSKTVTYDETYGDLPTPSKVGYTFLGWYTGISGGDRISSNTIVNIIENQTLYARWKANQYTVTFSGASSKTVTYDQPYGILPGKSGYSTSSSSSSGRCTTTTTCYHSFTGWGITSNTIVKTPHDHSFSPFYNMSCNTSTYCEPEPVVEKPIPPSPTTPSKPESKPDPKPKPTPKPPVKPVVCTPSCTNNSCGSDVDIIYACGAAWTALRDEEGKTNYKGEWSPENQKREKEITTIAGKHYDAISLSGHTTLNDQGQRIDSITGKPVILPKK